MWSRIQSQFIFYLWIKCAAPYEKIAILYCNLNQMFHFTLIIFLFINIFNIDVRRVSIKNVRLSSHYSIKSHTYYRSSLTHITVVHICTVILLITAEISDTVQDYIIGYIVSRDPTIALSDFK